MAGQWDTHSHACVWGVGHAIEQTPSPLLLAVTRKSLPLTYLQKKGKKKRREEERRERITACSSHTSLPQLGEKLACWWLIHELLLQAKKRERRWKYPYLFICKYSRRLSWTLVETTVQANTQEVPSACHKSSHGNTDFFLNWLTWSLCTTCSFLITDEN